MCFEVIQLIRSNCPGASKHCISCGHPVRQPGPRSSRAKCRSVKQRSSKKSLAATLYMRSEGSPVGESSHTMFACGKSMKHVVLDIGQLNTQSGDPMSACTMPSKCCHIMGVKVTLFALQDIIWRLHKGRESPVHKI